MVVWFIDSEELLESLISVINSKRLSNVVKKLDKNVYHATTVCMSVCKHNHGL